MTRPRLLDLFCGAGGAAMGYHRAGFDVTGVDIAPQPHYPFDFLQADATTWPLGGFDAIHASPPCEDFSMMNNYGLAKHGTGWMLAFTRTRLERQAAPWVIENVPGAPMRPDYKLCGCMFGLARLRRERWFETSWHGFEMRSPCYHIEPAVPIAGHGPTKWYRDRHGPVWIAERRQVMGIDWPVDRDGLRQAIPPAYTEHIGGQLMAHLRERAA